MLESLAVFELGIETSQISHVTKIIRKHINFLMQKKIE